jgi:uncharacterized protein YukE
MTYSVPSSFAPLASSNPVPADTDAMTSLGQQYTQTAALIAQQASDLQQLSSDSGGFWQSKAGTKFASKASGLASRVSQAQDRYSTAGTALTNAAGPMNDAQQQAYAAVAAAQEAQAAMTANAPSPAPAAGSPPLTSAQKAAAATAASNYGEAQDSLSSAQANFNSAVDDYNTAASTAAKAINDELDHDPLKDSWFQAHFGWLLKFFKILSYIVMALAIIALLIACPFSAGIIAGIVGVSMSTLATVGAIAGWTAFAIGIGQTIFDGVGAGEGLESWTSFALDIVGDASFGVGLGAAKAGDSVVDAATDAGKEAKIASATADAKTAGSDAANTVKTSALDAVSSKASADASQEFTDMAKAHNAYLAANPGAAGPSAFSPADIIAGAKAAGENAAKAALDDTSIVAKATADATKAYTDSAAAEIETAVKAATADKAINTLSGNLTSLATGSSDITKQIAALNAINKTIPNVAKVGTSITKLKGIAGVAGVFATAGFGLSTYGVTPS